MVLRTMVNAYVGEAQPIGSESLSHVLPMKLSSASVRTILSELAGLGLVEKPYSSSGRVPTERGLRLFIDQLLDFESGARGSLGSYEMRSITYSVDGAETDSVVNVTSQLLSESTHQLGFVVSPSVEQVVLRQVSLVRLSTERVLVVLVSQTGAPHRRVIPDEGQWDQPELDRIGAMLTERVAGRTIVDARSSLIAEAKALRSRADALLARAIELGRRAVAAGDDDVDLIIETRLALLDQPEFHDSQRIRDLFSTLETKERLLEILDQMLESSGVRVAFGEEVDEPRLRQCALVASRYGATDAQGVLGVIGPVRMDYGRVIPLVDFFSQVITDRLSNHVE
jgi:heat-inducible transcriptional repressor